MNVLRLVYEWPPPWDGLTPGPFELTRGQTLLGDELRVLCGGWPRHSTEHLPRVAVRRLPSALPRLSLFASTAPAALAWTLRWRRWANVIHGHGHLPLWYHLWRRASGDRTPYVLHLHVTAAGREAITRCRGLPVGFWTRHWEWPLHKLSDRVGCRVADAVICTSESVRNEALSLCGADPEKTFVLANGVNIERFSPGEETARRQYDLSPDDQVMLFVGSLSLRKRPDLLVEVLRLLPSNWKLLLVGRGPMERQLRSRVQDLGLVQRVRFAGYVPYPRLPALYRAADVMALVSEYEGFPKVVLEALACGVPVVTTRSFQGDGHIASHLTTLQQSTPNEIAAALQQAISGPLVDVERIRAEYDWRVKAKSVQEIYQMATDRQIAGAKGDAG